VKALVFRCSRQAVAVCQCYSYKKAWGGNFTPTPTLYP